MADTTRSDVEDIFGDSALTDAEKDNIVSIANRLADDAYSGQLRTLGEIEGNEKDFKTFLAAHMWELAEGGEISSESQTGGNVTFNHMTGDVTDSLTETRFGRQCLLYLRHGASISVEKT